MADTWELQVYIRIDAYGNGTIFNLEDNQYYANAISEETPLGLYLAPMILI